MSGFVFFSSVSLFVYINPFRTSPYVYFKNKIKIIVDAGVFFLTFRREKLFGKEKGIRKMAAEVFLR